MQVSLKVRRKSRRKSCTKAFSRCHIAFLLHSSFGYSKTTFDRRLGMPGLQLLLACFLLLLQHIYGTRLRFGERKYRTRENEFRPKFEYNTIEDQTCPKNFRCILESWCRPAALRSIRGPKQTCGYTNNWKTRICCPLRIPRDAFPNEPPYRPTPNPWTSFVPNVPAKPWTPPNGDTECGKPKVEPARRGYVVGGKHAKQGAWPWMVAIAMKSTTGVPNTLCTGFLIDRQHVLTAAHCFEDKRKRRQYTVISGHVDLTKSHQYNIQRIHIHPGFKNAFFYNDIALLTLTKPVQSNNFSPICLPWSREFMDLTDMGTSIAGWGVTTFGSKTASLTLMELNAIPVVSNRQCNEAYIRGVRNYQIDFPRGITKELICAGLIDKGGKDSCHGDSGGPLMFEYKYQWYAIGIVAFGAYCGMPGVPGGYTKVSEYLDWIDQNRKDV